MITKSSREQFEELVRKFKAIEETGLIRISEIMKRDDYDSDLIRWNHSTHFPRADYMLNAEDYEVRHHLEYDAKLSISFAPPATIMVSDDILRKLHRHLGENYPDIFLDVTSRGMDLFRVIAEYDVKTGEAV